MNPKVASVAALILFVAAAAAPAWAAADQQTRAAGGRTGKMEKAAQEALAPMINVVTQWIFPAVAFAAALYGVVRGIKRGEWDFTVLCLLASIALALLPGILGGLFF